MDSQRSQAAAAARRILCATAPVALALTLLAGAARAQMQGPAADSAQAKHPAEVYRTFRLTNFADPREMVGLENVLREMLPGAKVAEVTRQQAILVRGTPEDIETAGKILADLDQPLKEQTRHTAFLANLTGPNELNDTQTDLRNLFPEMKIYGIAGERAISLEGTPADVEAGLNVIKELDRPQTTYRLTYTFTETDNGQPAGVRHVSLLVTPAERGKTTLRMGEKVPILTGMKDSSNPSENAEVQYIDVGLKIEASLDAATDALTLHSKVEQSSISTEKSAAPDPIVLENTLDTSSNLVPGKQQLLGSLDIPGTSKHLEISVVAETVK